MFAYTQVLKLLIHIGHNVLQPEMGSSDYTTVQLQSSSSRHWVAPLRFRSHKKNFFRLHSSSYPIKEYTLRLGSSSVKSYLPDYFLFPRPAIIHKIRQNLSCSCNPVWPWRIRWKILRKILVLDLLTLRRASRFDKMLKSHIPVIKLFIKLHNLLKRLMINKRAPRIKWKDLMRDDSSINMKSSHLNSSKITF